MHVYVSDLQSKTEMGKMVTVVGRGIREKRIVPRMGSMHI